MKYICYFILVVILVLGILFVSGCVQQSKTIKLDFNSGPCDESVNVYNQSELGIKRVTWLDNNTLLVEVYIRLVCACENVTKGDYEINGTKIVLKYKVDAVSDVCATCMCVHKLDYKFTNLEKKDYQFELEQIMG
ncbi:MAG: hypothetical protein QXP53_02615 [Candidatus Pacearchaeota archaeon]